LKKTDLAHILKPIYPVVAGLGHSDSKKVFPPLFNFVENIVAENDELKVENQKLKDENNRLKGEQGKPDIKPNKKDGDISSEDERKAAEANLDEKNDRKGFNLDKAALKKLKETALPADLLEKLLKISHEEFTDEATFIKRIEALIGRPLSDEQRAILIKHAIYKKRNSKTKIGNIIIDRIQICTIDKTLLPTDARLKSYLEKTVQEIIFQRDNVLLRREVYYSPSLNKYYTADVPIGFEGDYGPILNTNIITMKYVNGMSIPKIKELFQNIGIQISGTTISNKLTKSKAMEIFHKEIDDLYKVVLASFKYIQIDDTGSRVNGVNHYNHILCNPYFTLFFTCKHKDRLTILDLLRHFEPRKYLLNKSTIPFLESLKVSETHIDQLSKHMQDESYNEKEMLSKLKLIYDEKNPQLQTRILEACAICNFRQETGYDVLSILVCDDAPQFKLLTLFLALCWIHNGRHYKKLNPIISVHQEMLEAFLTSFWAYYRKLILYKQSPTPEQAIELSKEFDKLFSTKTGYDELDDRIEKSKNQKEELLAVLIHPEIPLHNNASENAARTEKRYQDVSFQTITKEGTKAKDTLQSSVATLKKNGVSAYQFILDRVTGAFKMPSLADMVRKKADVLD
jgi:hypothetical protein